MVFWKKTGLRSEKSVLENYIAENCPDIIIEHRWTSCEGTGKNIFGMAVLFGHGRPGPIMEIPDDVLEEWIQNNEQEAVLNFYELLCSDEDEDLKRQRINEIVEEIFDLWESR